MYALDGICLVIHNQVPRLLKCPLDPEFHGEKGDGLLNFLGLARLNALRM